jgi:hypothetical protein
MKKKSNSKDFSAEKGHSQKGHDAYPLYIAGIGTSAGELNAFNELLKHLHVDSFSIRRYLIRHRLLSRIKNYIQYIKPSKVDSFSIRRRLISRMYLSRIKTIKNYIQYIKENTSEPDNLYQDFLINITIKVQYLLVR